MQDLLVFSHPSKLKCAGFLTRTDLLLAGDQYFSVFSLVSAKVVHQHCFQEEVMPIAMWMAAPNCIVLQGKMGYNYVFTVEQNKEISYAKKYPTHVHGFCKMFHCQPQALVGISEEQKAILVYNIVSGQMLGKATLEEEKLCESITCLQVLNQSEDSKLIVYLAQEGSKIHKFVVEVAIKEEGEDLVEALDSFQIKSNQEIKIIIGMQMETKTETLYCLLRRSPMLYIISTQPSMAMLHAIDFKLSVPRHLTLYNPKASNPIFYFADGNKVMKLVPDPAKLSTLAFIHQSKTIESLCLDSSAEALCGCTEEKQFFYLDLTP